MKLIVLVVVIIMAVGFFIGFDMANDECRESEGLLDKINCVLENVE